MKTLILMLAVALASPAYSQTDYSKSQESSVSGSSSESMPSRTEYQNESAKSGTLSEPSAPQTEESRLSGGNENMETETTTTTETTEERLSGASPTQAAPQQPMQQMQPMQQAQPTQPMQQPAQPAQTAPTINNYNAPATADTTSRTQEGMAAREQRKSGFYIEPALVGLQQDVDARGRIIGSDVNGTSNGFGADLKLGGHIGQMFFLAADGRYERVRLAETSFEDVNADVLNYGATVGLQAPWAGVRIWGTYVLGGTYDPQAAGNGADLKFEDPYGWRAGLGFRFQAVSLNLEYQDLTYQTTKIESLGTIAAANAGNVDFGQRGYALSLSFPIEL